MALSDVKLTTSSPLANFVAGRLAELDLKPIEFARLHNFDQGMLSKILTSVKIKLELETALRLAEGLKVPPSDFLSLLGKEKSHELISRLYLVQNLKAKETKFDTFMVRRFWRIVDTPTTGRCSKSRPARSEPPDEQRL